MTRSILEGETFDSTALAQRVLTVDTTGAYAAAGGGSGLTDAQLRASAVPVSLSANQSVNLAQLAATTVDTNSGTKSAGTQRVVIATDQPALTNKLLVTPDSVALPANQSVNNAQIGGNTISAGAGASGTGVQRVVLATDTTVPNVTGNAASAAADSGNPVKVGGKYNSANITLTDAQRGDAQLDVNGFLRTTLATAIDKAIDSITAAPFGHSFVQVTADTLVKTGAGTLHSVIISQNDAAPTAGSIDIYDNTAASGTKIFTHTQTTAVFMPLSLTFNAAFATGLYIDFTTTADVSVTLVYR